MTQTPLTVTERQARYKAAQEEAGRVRRNVWATPEEHEAIKRLLEELRKDLTAGYGLS